MDIFGFDAFSPPQIVEKVGTVGIAKTRLPLLALFMLGMCGLRLHRVGRALLRAYHSRSGIAVRGESRARGRRVVSGAPRGCHVAVLLLAMTVVQDDYGG